MPFACVFNCCRQQTVIPLKLPCVHACVSLVFGEGWASEWVGMGVGVGVLENAGLGVYVCMCVCMRDVQRNAL